MRISNYIAKKSAKKNRPLYNRLVDADYIANQTALPPAYQNDTSGVIDNTDNYNIPFFDRVTLCSHLGIPVELLSALINSESTYNYSTFYIDKDKTKKNGRAVIVPYSEGLNLREINAPHKGLQAIQIALLDAFKQLPYHFANHAYIANRSIHTAVEAVKHGSTLIHADLKSFFDEHTSLYVKTKLKKVLTQEGITWSDSFINDITSLVCRKNMLPQGSPCSPMLTIILNVELDKRIQEVADKYDMVYARYADDLWFAGNFNVANSNKFKTELGEAVHPFRLNYAKFGIMKESAFPVLRSIEVTFPHRLQSSHSAKIIQLFNSNLSGISTNAKVTGRTINFDIVDTKDYALDDIKLTVASAINAIKVKYPSIAGLKYRLKFFYIQAVKDCLGMHISNDKVHFPRKKYTNMRLTAYLLGKQLALNVIVKAIKRYERKNPNDDVDYNPIVNALAEYGMHKCVTRRQLASFMSGEENSRKRYRNLLQHPINKRSFYGSINYLKDVDPEKAQKLKNIINNTLLMYTGEFLNRLPASLYDSNKKLILEIEEVIKYDTKAK